VQHPCWGIIGLPLRALLYIREKDLAKIAPGLMRNRTSFIIAHRLATVRKADRIFVLKMARRLNREPTRN
jgi:ABC-type multidrug transport system fused ATPase/permease subunit